MKSSSDSRLGGGEVSLCAPTGTPAGGHDGQMSHGGPVIGRVLNAVEPELLVRFWRAAIDDVVVRAAWS